jgi:hypothetical protein
MRVVPLKSDEGVQVPRRTWSPGKRPPNAVHGLSQWKFEIEEPVLTLGLAGRVANLVPVCPQLTTSLRGRYIPFR